MTPSLTPAAVALRPGGEEEVEAEKEVGARAGTSQGKRLAKKSTMSCGAVVVAIRKL